MAKKPSYLSDGALPLKRRKVGVTRNENKAPRGKKIETDPHEGTEETENNPQKGEGTSETAWDHLNLSCNNGIHLGSLPP